MQRETETNQQEQSHLGDETEEPGLDLDPCEWSQHTNSQDLSQDSIMNLGLCLSVPSL